MYKFYQKVDIKGHLFIFMSEKIMNFINEDLTDRFQVKPSKKGL